MSESFGRIRLVPDTGSLPARFSATARVPSYPVASDLLANGLTALALTHLGSTGRLAALALAYLGGTNRLIASAAGLLACALMLQCLAASLVACGSAHPALGGLDLGLLLQGLAACLVAGATGLLTRAPGFLTGAAVYLAPTSGLLTFSTYHLVFTIGEAGHRSKKEGGGQNHVDALHGQVPRCRVTASTTESKNCAGPGDMIL